MKYQFKHALITGGGSGIGLALSDFLSHKNTLVFSVDRHFHLPSNELKKNVQRCQLDVTSEDFVRNIKKKSTIPFDLVIHCAAISAVGKFETIKYEALDAVVNINLVAPICITRDLLKERLLADNVTHVFVSSLSCFTGYPGASVYAASKDGLTAFARCLRGQVSSTGGNVMVVFPGPTDTPHAEHYSPKGSSGKGRVSPVYVAQEIIHRAQYGRHSVVLGVGNSIVSVIAKLFPRFATRMMAHWLLPKLEENKTPTTDPFLNR